MDKDVSHWLKNDLGLVHMGEDGVFPLLYHPRHGTLCRRLIKLLLDSTLCQQRYPNVYAREEFEEAIKEFEDKSKEVTEMRATIEYNLQSLENGERKKKFLSEKLDYLTGINHLQKNTSEALEVMAGRSNFDLEKVGRIIQDPKYLGNLELESVYSNVSVGVASSDMSYGSCEENYNQLIEGAQKMNYVYTKLIHSIRDKMESTNHKVELEKVTIADLAALKMPDDEEVVIEADPEEKKLTERHKLLVAKVTEAHQQVVVYSNEHSRRRGELFEKFKNEMSLLKPFLEFVDLDGQ